jgi:hypothetical protein
MSLDQSRKVRPTATATSPRLDARRHVRHFLADFVALEERYPARTRA